LQQQEEAFARAERETAPAPSRRAPARELSAAPNTSRERSSFVPPLDADWDTPAYQRMRRPAD